jgi:hypothetical protein
MRTSAIAAKLALFAAVLFVPSALGASEEVELKGKAWHFVSAAAYPGWVFLLWGMGLVLHWLLLTCFPERTSKLTAAFETAPWKGLFIGLVNLFVLFVVVGAAVATVPPLGLLLGLAASIALFIGIHGRSRALGRKILRAAGYEPAPFTEATVGWSAVAFLWAIPYFGWTVLFAYFFAGGLGALTFSLFRNGTAKGTGETVGSDKV